MYHKDVDSGEMYGCELGCVTGALTLTVVNSVHVSLGVSQGH